MKFKELKTLSDAELNEKLAEIRRELMLDYTQVSSGAPPKSPGMIRKRRRTVARILTLFNERSGEKKEVKNKK